MHTLEAAAGAHGATLRPMHDDDLPFCAELYASTRREEVAQTGWPEAAQEAFLASQHAAQHAHYSHHYSGAARFIIERAGVPIGRLYLDSRQTALHIIDIALLPQARGSGLAGALIAAIGYCAAEEGKAVSIHVEKTNPARRLYARLGFVVAPNDVGPYDRMCWQP